MGRRVFGDHGPLFHGAVHVPNVVWALNLIKQCQQSSHQIHSFQRVIHLPHQRILADLKTKGSINSYRTFMHGEER